MGEKKEKKHHCLTLSLSPKCKGEGDQTRITWKHTHAVNAHLYDSSNPSPGWPKGKETLVLINPSNKECRGHDLQKAALTHCRSWSFG